MHTFVANFLRYVTSKNYLNWIIFSQVFAKVKRVTFFETQCSSCSECNFDVMLSVNNNPDSGYSVPVLYSALLIRVDKGCKHSVWPTIARAAFGYDPLRKRTSSWPGLIPS